MARKKLYDIKVITGTQTLCTTFVAGEKLERATSLKHEVVRISR